MPSPEDAFFLKQRSSNWQCPYCRHHQVRSDKTSFRQKYKPPLPGVRGGQPLIEILADVCANEKCRHLILSVVLRSEQARPGGSDVRLRNVWWLQPESTAETQPDYIPEALRQDYYEACKIKNLSPKASATLARRCLQGMIRDFCGIRKGTLKAEIDALRKTVNDSTAPPGVTPETVDGIDHVRSLGNIGAHMEKDVNLLIEVEPEEAQLLIGLIEMLFKEWYVAREARRQHLEQLRALADAKEAERDQGSRASAPGIRR